MPDSFAKLDREVVECERCPRLREYCRGVAEAKRRAFQAWTYWGRPVTGFGDPQARIWIVGLAPAAHGANRTGRVFTGDRSGDFLFAALHRAGLANQPTSVRADDGLTLRDVFVSASVRCAPPDNKPLPSETAHCAEYLLREWNLLAKKRVLLALGKIAWEAATKLIRERLGNFPSRSSFAHGATASHPGGITLVGSYHVSQQNTFTGRLTPAMFDEVLQTCLPLCGVG